jgi:hypothetical protein
MRNNISGGKNRFINLFIVSKNWYFCLRMFICQQATASRTAGADLRKALPR